MKIARGLRTIRSLRPIQIAWRPVHAVLRRGGRLVPESAPPAVRQDWPAPPQGLRELLARDADRAAARIERLPRGSALRAFEEQYGFELLRGRTSLPKDRGAVGYQAFPASVRARNIALAARLGSRGLESDLARACRAILLQLELHLLGNHLLENGIGLACGGAAAAGAEADLWWRLGSKLVTSQLEEQFLPDGGHFERSASYHLWLLAGLLELMHLAGSAGRNVPSSWRSTAQRALGWALAIRAPDGTIPLFNDATLDASPLVDWVVALARAVGVTVPGEALREQRSANAWVRVLPDTGWVIAGAADDAWLVVDAGADGAPYQPGHVHADALSFELWVGGARVCVDYGVSSYGTDESRYATRRTRSHNTVEVDGTDCCEVWSAFRVGRRCNARVRCAAVEDGTVRVEAEHDGYRWLPGAPTHSRVFELEVGQLRVTDRVLGRCSTAVSRLRLDREAWDQVTVESYPEPVSQSEGAWYPEFAGGRPAVVLEQSLGSDRVGTWLLRW